VVILDQDRLFEFSGFNPNYLHPAHRRGGQSNKDINSGNCGKGSPGETQGCRHSHGNVRGQNDLFRA
jgi:hypothetical protein